MKKMILFGIAVVFSINIASSQNNTDVLPQNAQDFINKHFSSENIEKAEKEDGLLNMDENEAYEVHLTNGVKIDFDKNGNITEIDSRNDAQIPESAIPANILTYVQDNYSSTHITSWGMNNNEQEVELSDGTDLEFDANGDFLRED